ncbi:MAG TPA: hypothetical protein DCM40_21670 [Maribacter sp.]|nr:hypothetical protein [Maribacter sp.]
MRFSPLILEQLTYILAEGRKEDALKRVVKGIDNPEVVEHVKDVFKQYILMQDPSGKQKYAMWAAGMINDRVVRLIRNYNSGNENDKARGVPEGKYEATRRANQIRSSLSKYHKLAQKNLIEKDINKFKDLGDWEQKIYIANRELEEREAMARRKEKAKETSNIIDDTADWMMVRPNDEDGSCYYGQGTKWCISATDSRNYFDEYSGKGKVFYFLLFKHLNNDDPMKRIALVYDHRDVVRGDAYEPEEVFDAPDDEVGTGGITDAIYANLVMKGYALGQGNPKEFLKIFRSARGRDNDGPDGAAFNAPDEIYDNVLDFTQDIIDTFTKFMNDYFRDEDTAVPKPVAEVLRGLGLGDPQENDVYEDFNEMVSDEYSDIIGQSVAHAAENPGGKSVEDYEEIIAEAGLQNINVYIDPYYDQGELADTVSGDASFDFSEEGMAPIDEDTLRDIVNDALTENSIYPFEVRSEDESVYIVFNPDYDEGGWDGFQAFVSRMQDYDERFKDARDTAVEMLQDQGYFPSEETEANLKKFEDMDLQNFDVDLEDGKVTMTTFLPVRLYLPPELISKVKSGGEGAGVGSERDRLSQMYSAIFQGLRQDMHTLKDKIIQRLRTQTDKALEIIASQMPLNLSEAETGHPIPDTNINVGFRAVETGGTSDGGFSSKYKFADRTQVWLDIQLEPNEEPQALKIIEKFVKMADNEKFHDKLRQIAEAIVTNLIVKKILPKFEKDYAYKTMRQQDQQRQVAEQTFYSFDDWKVILKEWRAEK